MAAGAALGYSKLDIVNALAEQIGQQPFAALTSSSSWPSKTYTSDICSQLERVVDRHTVQVLREGVEFNIVGPIEVTPSAGVITIATNSAFNDLYVLNVIPEGRNKRRPMALRPGTGTIYDPQTGLSSGWTEFATYQMTLVVGYEVQNCPVNVQILIRDSAIKELTETRLGDQLRRTYAVENLSKSEMLVERHLPTRSNQPAKIVPTMQGQPLPLGG